MNQTQRWMSPEMMDDLAARQANRIRDLETEIANLDRRIAINKVLMQENVDVYKEWVRLHRIGKGMIHARSNLKRQLQRVQGK